MPPEVKGNRRAGGLDTVVMVTGKVQSVLDQMVRYTLAPKVLGHESVRKIYEIGFGKTIGQLRIRFPAVYRCVESLILRMM
jgi:hypothetical protein